MPSPRSPWPTARRPCSSDGLRRWAPTIRSAVEKRISGKRLVVEADWRKLLDAHLAAQSTGQADELEESARAEKTAALKELAESRLSVLIGPAGTGKTTLLSVLCSHPKIEAGGILLLAPTGKARVRMEQSTKGLKLKGYTIAQFLSPHRYDGATGRYRLSEQPTEAGAHTVIIDEASMLTEEMLAALIQALKGVHRLHPDRRSAPAPADRRRAALRRHREAARAGRRDRDASRASAPAMPS